MVNAANATDQVDAALAQVVRDSGAARGLARLTKAWPPLLKILSSD
jgi:hypothetical protein